MVQRNAGEDRMQLRRRETKRLRDGQAKVIQDAVVGTGLEAGHWTDTKKWRLEIGRRQ